MRWLVQSFQTTHDRKQFESLANNPRLCFGGFERTVPVNRFQYESPTIRDVTGRVTAAAST